MSIFRKDVTELKKRIGNYLNSVMQVCIDIFNSSGVNLYSNVYAVCLLIIKYQFIDLSYISVDIFTFPIDGTLKS